MRASETKSNAKYPSRYWRIIIECKECVVMDSTMNFRANSNSSDGVRLSMATARVVVEEEEGEGGGRWQ